MTLKKYKEKRDLAKSEEPASGHKSSSKLHFVIQKHAARHLHYDLRLEYKGVLLSWAVPKGPSLDPSEKRLAIQVEDHPLDYQYFEGTIPKGHYGAGTVEIWDKGTYTTPDHTEPKEIEKYMKQGLTKGHFSIIFHGKRLRGEFSFVKMKQTENEWLLIKKEDAYATSEDVIPEKKSLKKKDTDA